MMKLSFLSSLFKKDKKSLRIPDSLLIKKLKNLSEEQNFFIFDNITLFHHASEYYFPLILLDESRGLYIFEKKEWAYDDLKNAKVQKAQNQKTSKDTLSFQKKQDIIHQKLKELRHFSDLPIYNYLLMENLNADEYEHLDISFQELIPIQKVIFSDTPQEEILKKLQTAQVNPANRYTKNDILGNLLIQYTLLDANKEPQFCNPQQRAIIDHEVYGLESLQAPKRSGKTSTLLLKAIFHVLTHKNSQVLIIKPTHLACDILKQKLLDIIEHAIIDFNILDILIVTPYEFLDIKKSDIPQLVLCDDANLFKNDFILQLIDLQKEANLLLVNYKIATYTHTLQTVYPFHNKSITFYHAHKQAKALLLIARLLKENKAHEIMILSNTQTQQELIEDLEYFIKESTTFLSVEEPLRLQTLDALIFVKNSNIDELNPKHLLILDAQEADMQHIELSIQKTSHSVHIVYEKLTDKITSLKEKYDSHKN